jgi:hypothetical protein
MRNSKKQDKNLTQNQQTSNNTTNPDSMTKVNLRLGGVRVPCSFKCNKELWKSFVSQIRAQGLSVCHVLEPMILGYLTSTVYLSNTIKPLKIENLVVERAVKRVRRYGVEVEAAPGSNAGSGGGRFVDFYDLDGGGVWRRVEVESDLDVNEFGHFVGCGCSVCRKGVKRS